MDFLAVFIVVSLWFMYGTEGQRVFTKSDFGRLITVFSGTDCPNSENNTIKNPGYFRYLEVSRKNSSILYVGAMNYVFKLDISQFRCKNYNTSVPDSKTKRRCRIRGKKDIECQNHIRVIMEFPNYLLVCGTGGYAPKKYTMDENLQINETSSGVQMCPFDPFDNYTALLVTSGNPCNATVPYIGTYADFLKSKPVLFRPAFTCPSGDQSYSEQTTDHKDRNWFNFPQFVGSFDDHEKVLFFFREVSVEHPTLKNKIVSRVGKVCKQDLGGKYKDNSKNKWLSFQKALLSCSVPGTMPYNYDHIYDVYHVGNLFFALFYQQPGVDSSRTNYTHIVDSSVICVYRKEDMESVFKGKFQHKGRCTWTRLPNVKNPNPRFDNCTAHRDNPEIFKDKVLRYQLMNSPVNPMYGEPIFYKAGVQFINIVVSETKYYGQETGRNIYLASTEGEIYDIFFKTFDQSTVPFLTSKSPTIYRPFGSEKHANYAIWNMKYQNGNLLLGTDYEVTKVEVASLCDKIKKIDVCIINTNCKWNSCSMSCEKALANQEGCDKYLNWAKIGPEGVLSFLKEEIYSEIEFRALYGLSFTLPLYTPVDVDDLIWVKNTGKTDCSGENVLEEDSENYAVSRNGSLIKKNVSFEDNDTTYTACTCSDCPDVVKLKTYRITVVRDDDQLKKVWKQQYNDRSTEFSRWKGCAKEYVEVCAGENQP